MIIDWRDAAKDRKPPVNYKHWCPRCRGYSDTFTCEDEDRFGERDIKCVVCSTTLFKKRSS